MKRVVIVAAILLIAIGLMFGWGSIREVAGQVIDYFYTDADMGPFYNNAKNSMTKEEFMLKRAEQLSMYRGISEGSQFNPSDRFEAIEQMERQELARANMADTSFKASLLDLPWTEIGPNPIPNAQVEFGSGSASGRVLAIAVHPTNPDIVYVGTAQGGLYRSTNGGTTWTPLLDSALSLAVNTVAIAPSNPEIVYVGTGESGFCGDCFFGAGVYRIDNASTTANLSAAFGATTTFNGRSISKIVVHPTDPATIFVTSSSGSGGIGGQQQTGLAARGVFRSTDATGVSPTFTKLTIGPTPPAAQDRAYGDMVMDPGDPNRVLVALVDTFGATEGGVYLSTNALAVTPTFTRTFTVTQTGANSRTELALHRSGGGVVTVYAASGHLGGTVQRSVDGGATWTQMIDNNFCTGQCFYDIAVGVDPTDANNVYLGGSPNLVFGRSANGGTTFTADGVNFTAGLHVDSHAIAVAPSNPLIVYFGSDGGIYRTSDVSATPIVWTSLNNSTFRATQFMSLDVHPTDPNITIGGTQDNGTNRYTTGATWTRTDFGDGGFAVIDQSSSNTTTFNQYHTYFNATTLTGYAFSSSSTAFENWAFRGCQGPAANGITCATTINFYAPLERGPGTPNTVYYGADRLYRSADTGLNHTTVSQIFTTPISAIGIAPSNDNVRIIGQNNGGIFGTTTGVSPLVDMDPTNAIPNSYVGRAAIHPTNPDIAYVTLAAFGVVNVWRTSTLSSLADNIAPTWTAAAGTGANVLPQVPVNAFLIDPVNPNLVYAGTDIGVYVSGDQGTNWFPMGTGLPRVAVFDMAMAPGQIVRIATHGRGMWQIPAIVPSAANVSVSGRVLTAEGQGVRNAVVTITDSTGVSRSARTASFGFYRFNDVRSGETYVISVSSKRYVFTPRTINVTDEVTGFDFVASP